MRRDGGGTRWSTSYSCRPLFPRAGGVRKSRRVALMTAMSLGRLIAALRAVAPARIPAECIQSYQYATRRRRNSLVDFIFLPPALPASRRGPKVAARRAYDRNEPGSINRGAPRGRAGKDSCRMHSIVSVCDETAAELAGRLHILAARSSREPAGSESRGASRL